MRPHVALRHVEHPGKSCLHELTCAVLAQFPDVLRTRRAADELIGHADACTSKRYLSVTAACTQNAIDGAFGVGTFAAG